MNFFSLRLICFPCMLYEVDCIERLRVKSWVRIVILDCTCELQRNAFDGALV